MRLFRIIENATGRPLIIDGQMDLSSSELSRVKYGQPGLFNETHPYEPTGCRIVEVVEYPDVGLIEVPITPETR